MSHKCCNRNDNNNSGICGVNPIIIIIIIAVLFCGNLGNSWNKC